MEAMESQPEGGKLDRTAVNYRAARRDKRCGTCARFDAAARACSVVAGAVAANMVCDRWTIMPGLTRRDLEPPRR
jgi:hypothetical protein